MWQCALACWAPQRTSCGFWCPWIVLMLSVSALATSRSAPFILGFLQSQLCSVPLYAAR